MRVVDLTVDRPRNRNYKMCKFKNTHTQDNGQLFQLIGQIHSKMCVWRHIPPEIEFKSRGSDSNVQRCHRHGKNSKGLQF